MVINKKINNKSKIKKIYPVIKFFLRVFLFFPFLLQKIFRRNDLVENLVIPFCEVIQEHSSYFINCNFRPKYSSMPGVRNQIIENFRLDSVGIVVQGPIKYDDNFTLESIRFYKKYFPNVKIIISTWKGVKKQFIESISQFDNCYLIESELPEFSGVGNVNYQTFSSYTGMIKAKELNCEYVLKTRADVRINNPNCLTFFLDLIDKYQCLDELHFNQCKRLIIFNSYLFKPYSFNDFFTFGYIDDMINFWATDRNDQKISFNQMTFEMNLSEDLPYKEQFMKYVSPELFIMTNYINRKGRALNCSIQEYWTIMRDYFIPLNTSMMDAYWSHKKGREHWREENLMNCSYIRPIYWSPKLINQYFDFTFWQQLLDTQFINSLEYENILTNDGSSFYYVKKS